MHKEFQVVFAKNSRLIRQSNSQPAPLLQSRGTPPPRLLLLLSFRLPLPLLPFLPLPLSFKSLWGLPPARRPRPVSLPPSLRLSTNG